jgi:hypothetical protein
MTTGDAITTSLTIGATQQQQPSQQGSRRSLAILSAVAACALLLLVTDSASLAFGVDRSGRPAADDSLRPPRPRIDDSDAFETPGIEPRAETPDAQAPNALDAPDFPPTSTARHTPPRAGPTVNDAEQVFGQYAGASRRGEGRPFRFYMYPLPHSHAEGAVAALQQRWDSSICNRRRTNYTMLDWRHAHSLFTADVYIARYLRQHPAYTSDAAVADVFLVPMMTHLYNCAGLTQYAMDVLTTVGRDKAHWQMGTHDHYVFWWRWGMNYGFVQKFWRRLMRDVPNVNFISFDFLELQGRNEFQDFSLALRPNLPKNMQGIIMPYPDFSPPLRAARTDADLLQPRRTLFYFAGTSTIGGVRRWIKRACDDWQSTGHTDGVNGHVASPNSEVVVSGDAVYVDFASNVIDTKRLGIPTEYPVAMQQSLFCGHAAGDALSSRRPTSAILAGCIPVLVCDLCVYAWESRIDYEEFAVFISERDVIASISPETAAAIPESEGRPVAVATASSASAKAGAAALPLTAPPGAKNRMMEILSAIARDTARVQRLQRAGQRVRRHFVYTDGTPQPGDALDMLVGELEVRGRMYRSLRRWFRFNPDLSNDAKDYPADPLPRKKYVRRLASGAVDPVDNRDFNNMLNK